VQQAIEQAGITKEDLSAISFTKGPGLVGSLLVGTSFAKSLALGLNIPLIDLNHMQGHILAHFIIEENTPIPPSRWQAAHQRMPLLYYTAEGELTLTLLLLLL
jgi:N6-L-threonylcarbamoyladenine synthase